MSSHAEVVERGADVVPRKPGSIKGYGLRDIRVPRPCMDLHPGVWKGHRVGSG